MCSYRIVPESRVRLAGIVGALGEYQALISGFYDAVRRGPKATGHVTAEAAEETALDFAYAFAGSVGFVLTVPKVRSLFEDTDFGEAMELINELSKARNFEQILGYSKRLGRGPIRMLYRWADAHAKASFSADIEWKRGGQTLHKTLVQVPEFVHLKGAISESSDEEVEELTLPGTLIGANAKNHSFQFRPESGGDIRGSAELVINERQTTVIMRRYIATIRKTTRVFFSTETEQTRHELLRLVPISPAIPEPTR